MDLLPDEAQLFLRQAVADAVDRYAPFGVVREWAMDGDLGPADRLAGAQGWTGIGLAEQLGGQGGALQEQVVVAEQLGHGAVPWDLTMAGYLSTQVMAATNERGRQLAAANASGDRAAVLCLDARTPDAERKLSVHASRVTGEIPRVLGATGADVLVVAVPSERGEVELLAVDRGAEGVTLTPRQLVDRSRALADVCFEASPGELLGSVPATTWQEMIQTGIVLNCADSLGASARLLQMTIAYVQERHQFGVAVGSFQAVKHSAAQMLVDVEGMRSAVQYSAWAVETASDDAGLQASIAGAFCSQSAPDLADRALFLHGAIGYTWEHDLQLLFKRVKSNASLFGSTDWHQDRISGSLGLTPAP